MKAKFGNKGMEPFIADILLIMIGIAVAAMLLGFSGTFTSTELSQTATILNCTVAEMSITDVYLSGNTASVILRNPSRSDIVVSNAKLFHKTGPEGIIATQLPIVVPVGSLRRIEFVGAPICGNFDSVEVFTTCPGLNVRFTGSPKCSS